MLKKGPYIYDVLKKFSIINPVPPPLSDQGR